MLSVSLFHNIDIVQGKDKSQFGTNVVIGVARIKLKSLNLSGFKFRVVFLLDWLPNNASGPEELYKIPLAGGRRDEFHFFFSKVLVENECKLNWPEFELNLLN